MSYHVMGLLPRDLAFDLTVLEPRIRDFAGQIGQVRRARPAPTGTAGQVEVAFPGWSMYVSHYRGDEARGEIEDILRLFGSGKPLLARVGASDQHVDISVPEPPDQPQGEWFDYCWSSIEAIRSLGDIPIFDAAQGTWVFE